MSRPELWTACLAASAPISLLVPQASLLPPTPASALLEPYLHSQEQDFAPDNPFMLHYATLHHYRSLGWVIKSGIKFCADYLLYKRGPVFSHAECVTVPSSCLPPFGWVPESFLSCSSCSLSTIAVLDLLRVISLTRLRICKHTDS